MKRWGEVKEEMMSKGFFLAPVAAIMLTLSSFLPAAAQTSACALHDQMCIYHGIGRQMGYDPSGPTSITATANWDQPNDADLHALLPTGNTYSTPTEALPGYPLQLSEPFYPDVSGAHIYPNHYESQINGGAATATHSGDAGGGLAPYPGQPGCDPAIQSSVTCEAITVQGEVPSGVYSYAIHAFPASGSSFPLTNFSIDVRASGNMVLVSDNPGLQINPETGLIRQTGSFQGSGATTSQLDVYALNVGHAGHVGGVIIPQMELVSLSDGTQRYQPVEPLLFDETPSIQDQIAGAFLQRDQQVAYYEGLREQEKQRLAYLAELARARAAYNKWLADQEKAQAQQEKLVYLACPAPLKSCVPSYVQGEKFVLAQPATPAPCNPKYASCVTPPAKFWEPAKSWEQIVSETYQQSVVLPRNTTVSFEEYASQQGITLGNTSDSGAGSLVDGSQSRQSAIKPPKLLGNWFDVIADPLKDAFTVEQMVCLAEELCTPREPTVLGDIGKALAILVPTSKGKIAGDIIDSTSDVTTSIVKNNLDSLAASSKADELIDIAGSTTKISVLDYKKYHNEKVAEIEDGLHAQGYKTTSLSIKDTCSSQYCIPDIVYYDSSGKIVGIVEVKTGGAGYSAGQELLYPKARDGTARPGIKLADLLKLDPNLTFAEQGYPNGINVYTQYFPGLNE